MVDFSKMSDEQLLTAKKIRDEATSQGVDPAYALSIGHIESEFKPKAKAPSSTAQGPMQLIKGTAEQLKVDPSNTDENIKGGVSYIKQHMDKYKDPFVAAIAYKAGPGVADKFMQSKDLSTLDDETLKYLKEVKQRYKPTPTAQEQPKQVQVQKEPGVESVKLPTDIVSMGAMVAEPLKEGYDYLKEKGASLFQSGETRDIDFQKLKEKWHGGAVAGGLTGLAGPKALETAGKVVGKLPGGPITKGIGGALETAGKTFGYTPASARALSGGVGGATFGAVDEYLDASGYSPVTKFALTSLASGGTESLVNFTGKQLLTGAKLIGSGLLHSPGGFLNNMAKLSEKDKAMFVKEAATEQEKSFGKRIKGYVEGVIGNDKQSATTALLRDKYGVPADFEGPASKYIREGILRPKVGEISMGANNSIKFSNSPEFGSFQQEISRLVDKGTLSKSQGSDILGKLKTDMNANIKTRGEFHDTVDNLIREWGKGLEKSTPPTGYKAVTEKEAGVIRTQLRDAYNGWLEKQGLGQAEKEYRNAYAAEKKAELLDHINHSLTYINESRAFDKLAPLIKDGTYSKGEVLDGVRTYLGNANPKEILSKFEKIDRALVGNKLLPKEDMLYFENEAKRIKQIADEGLKTTMSERLVRGLVKQISYKVGTSIGAE
jgi:hypothetical protein